MKSKTPCTGLFDHSIEKMVTMGIDKHVIHKQCPKCGKVELLPRSNSNVYFVNNLVVQKKKWAADDNRKELIQPMHVDGSINNDFTEVYGYNPFDDRTKAFAPKL